MHLFEENIKNLGLNIPELPKALANYVPFKIIGKSITKVKIFGDTQIESKVKVEGLAVSKGARASIEKAGGSIVEIQETKTKNKEEGSE